MLFSDITDCEMLAFRMIMQSPEPVSLSEVMSRLEELYGRGWKQTTVCTFLSHLVAKGRQHLLRLLKFQGELV